MIGLFFNWQISTNEYKFKAVKRMGIFILFSYSHLLHFSIGPSYSKQPMKITETYSTKCFGFIEICKLLPLFCPDIVGSPSYPGSHWQRYPLSWRGVARQTPWRQSWSAQGEVRWKFSSGPATSPPAWAAFTATSFRETNELQFTWPGGCQLSDLTYVSQRCNTYTILFSLWSNRW